MGNTNWAPLQQGLPRDNDLYFVIGGHDLAEDNRDGGGVSGRWRNGIGDGHKQQGGGGIIKRSEETLNFKILL